MKILVVDDSIFVRQFVKNICWSSTPTLSLILRPPARKATTFIRRNARYYHHRSADARNGRAAFHRKIRQTDLKTKIIVLSADIQQTVKDEISALKVTAFLHKPINRESVRFIAGLIDE